uniref:BED-type domain-containing protein n=1 Tax=Strongyloides papillosus TaxID=174720 RepID=A0A0N5C4H7_STREA
MPKEVKRKRAHTESNDGESDDDRENQICEVINSNTNSKYAVFFKKEIVGCALKFTCKICGMLMVKVISFTFLDSSNPAEFTTNNPRKYGTSNFDKHLKNVHKLSISQSKESISNKITKFFKVKEKEK